MVYRCFILGRKLGAENQGPYTRLHCLSCLAFEFCQIPVKGKHRGDRNQEEIEERVISIISSLFGENALMIICVFSSTLTACEHSLDFFINLILKNRSLIFLQTASCLTYW